MLGEREVIRYPMFCIWLPVQIYLINHSQIFNYFRLLIEASLVHRKILLPFHQIYFFFINHFRYHACFVNILLNLDLLSFSVAGVIAGKTTYKYMCLNIYYFFLIYPNHFIMILYEFIENFQKIYE